MKGKLLVVAIPFALLGCGSPNSQQDISEDKTVLITKKPDTTDPMLPPPPPPEAVMKWEYSEREDKMTSKPMYFASITAEEKLHFKSPYEGETEVQIQVRRKGKEQDVMLKISQGQFLSNIGDGRYIKARFDDGTAMAFGYSDPSDYSSETIFINNASRFISLLKKSKRLIIQCEFYDEGIQTMEFDVSGFKWEH